MAWESVAHLQWHGFIGFSLHPGLLAAPIPIPVPRLPHLSFSVLNGIPIPYGGIEGVGGLGSLPSNVRGQVVTAWGGIPMMGRGNDAGFIVPHISYPPTNWLLPLTILFGGSDSFAGSSQTKITCYKGLLQRIGENTTSEELDTAACIFPTIPFSLNFGCFEPILAPLDFVIAPNTVLVGMSVTDLLNTLIDFALAATVEVLMGAGGAAVGKIGKKIKKVRVAKAAKKSMKKATKAATEAQEKSLLKPTLKEALALRRAQVRARPKKSVPRALRRGQVRRAKKAGDEAFNKALREGIADPAAIRRQMHEDHFKVTVHFWGKPKWVRTAVEKAFWKQAMGKVGRGQVVGSVIDNRLRPIARKVTKEAFKAISKKISQEKSQQEKDQALRTKAATPPQQEVVKATMPLVAPQLAALYPEITEGEEIMATLGI